MKQKRTKKLAGKKMSRRHSHTAACTWIKPRRQISTWDRLNLQNKKVKKKTNKKETKEQRAKYTPNLTAYVLSDCQPPNGIKTKLF